MALWALEYSGHLRAAYVRGPVWHGHEMLFGYTMAVVRVFGALAWPSGAPATVAVSAVFWSSAFALYAIRYWPVLTRPRIDGMPG